MNDIQKQLAELDFCALLAEANAATATGANLINNYRVYCTGNPVNCNVINSFINEAKRQTYDSGINALLVKICNFINERQISWQIASVCEAIENDRNPKNYLARNAAHQATQLLEMQEDDVKKYIRAGALKNVQYIEQFRNITKAVLKESMKYVSDDLSYTTTNPISYVESVEDGNIFRVYGKTFKMTSDGDVCECNFNDSKFSYINALLESQYVFLNEDDSLTIKYDDIDYTIKTQGVCERHSKNSTLTLETSTLREYNMASLQTVLPAARNQKAAMLEAIALITENFDNIVKIDCAAIYQSADDSFYVIEGKTKLYAELISSTHASTRWSVNENAIETVKFIKDKTHVNLTEVYESMIDENIAEAEKAEKQHIVESLKSNEKKSFAQRIDALTEKFKDNPAVLRVIASVASEYAELNQ